MFIPVHLGEISNFQPQTRFLDTKTEVYNPFVNGFSFAVGFGQPLDPLVATFSLTYTEKSWNDDGTQSKQKIDVPMRPCIQGDGFPLTNTRATLSMYCPDKLNLTLTGDYFADQFQYLKLSLIPCVTSTQNKCKSATDVANFF